MPSSGEWRWLHPNRFIAASELHNEAQPTHVPEQHHVQLKREELQVNESLMLVSEAQRMCQTRSMLIAFKNVRIIESQMLQLGFMDCDDDRLSTDRQVSKYQ
jgi:hypothetical protein